MSKTYNKILRRKKGSVNWWNNLTLEEKQKHKKYYEKICDNKHKRKFPYTHLVNTKSTQISKLTDGQIYCICRFIDVKL